MVIVKRIGVLSLAKLQTILMAIMGLIIGIFYAIFSSFLYLSEYSKELMIPPGLAWLGIIIFPVFYGILGFVTGVIGAWLYNLIAKWVGGIELELAK